MSNFTPDSAAPQDMGQPGGDCQAAPLDRDKIPPVLKARLQLVAPPPVILFRHRPTPKPTGAPAQDRGAAGGGGRAVDLDLDKIPQELKDRLQWVVWRKEIVKGRLAKVPYQPRKPQKKASSTNRDTWGTFEQALNVAQTGGFQGIGYVFSIEDPYCGVDLDHCRNPETGEIAQWAWEIIRRLNSYTEISPSGTGVHILIRGTVPPGGNSKGLPNGGKVEMYSQARYFTMTGNHLGGTP
jgi:hypothetical protein